MEKVIYSAWVAYELRNKGFKIKRVEVNPHKPQYDCWVFDETEELQKAFVEIANSRKN